MNNIYYVYIYLDPRKRGPFKYGEYEFEYEPFYVGKGKGDRDRTHILYETFENTVNKFKYNKIQKIIKLNYEPIILKINTGMTEDISFVLEKDLIRIIGRRDLKYGPLTNMTDGGEGISGYKWTKKQIDNKIKSLKNSERFQNSLRCEKKIEKIRNTLKGRTLSESHIKNSSDAHRGLTYKNKGRPLTEEWKNNISNGLRERFGDGLTDEHKNKISKTLSNTLLVYDKNGIFVGEYDNQKIAAKELKLSQGNISEVLNGKRKTTGGYTFQKKDTL